MASLFKRLFSSGGGQTASVQVEEPIAETSAEEQTVDQNGAEDRAGEQAAPSEDELKEFLSKNFLDGAKPIEVPPLLIWTLPVPPDRLRAGNQIPARRPS